MPGSPKPKFYNPRHPERTLLYQTVAEYYETWLELASAGQFDGQGERGALMVPTLVTYEALATEGALYGLPQVSVGKIEAVRGAGHPGGRRGLGPGGAVGCVADGRGADVLLVDGNPLSDIGSMLGQGDQLRAIIKGGKRYK